MPEKNVREMSAVERRHYSLSARTFRAAATGCILLGLIAMVIGLGFYGYALSHQYVRHAFDLAVYAAASEPHGADYAGIADEVMAVYRSLSEEQRSRTGTEAYREYYAGIDRERGSNYSMLRRVLRDFLANSDVDALYLAMYDEASCAMVYVVDPDEPDPMYPGDWEAVTEKGMRKFLDWDGEGLLYDIGKPEKYGWMCTAGVPIRGDDGAIHAFILADVTLDNLLHGMHVYALQTAVALLLATALIAWLLARHMKKTLVEPINEIAQTAQEYVRDRLAGVKDVDHFALLNIRTGDEVENLSLVMADMEQDLNRFEDDLTRITVEKERISTELDLARRIQAAMLPDSFPAFPDRRDLDIYASMTPAKEVGGDFYDFFLLDETHLGLVMADVSGKGIPAALMMMVSKILIKNYTLTGRSPREVMEIVNSQFCQNNREEMFVTVWLGVLDLETGKLSACNAGHEYPILRLPGGEFELYKDPHGFVLGGLDGVRYKEYELQLKPGAKLFLYTDGLPEAMNAAGELFGTERSLRALNAAADRDAQSILKHVRREVDHFVGAAPQFDDMTMMCVEYYGKEEVRQA